METTRAFLAVPTPKEPARAIQALVDRMKPRLPHARFVPADQWHLTLHFFAALSAGEVDEVRQAARAATAAQGPFTLTLRGLGVFPDGRRPRVLWLGVEEGALECVRLHEGLAAALRSRGLPVEERPFHPHLTLARFRTPPPGGIGDALRQAPGHEAARFPVDRVTLFRSVLTPRGAEHTALDEFGLGGSSARGRGPGEDHGGR